MMNDVGMLLKFARPALLSAALMFGANAALAADAAPKTISIKDVMKESNAVKDINAAADPSPLANPALAGLLKTGAKAYFLGQRSGLNGWLLMKNGQIQAGYAPVGSSEVIVGAMFGADGENITAIQLGKLVETNPEVAAQLKGVLGVNAAGAATPEAAALNNAPAATADSPGEKLFKDLAGAAGVVLGNPAAPQVSMIMDTNCKHCRASWVLLRDYVNKGTIQLRMIPVGNMDSESERSAAVLLHVNDPVNSWNKYVGGDKSALAGTPSADAVPGLRANHALVDRWNIDSTPYFVYRAKDGKVKIIKGEIEKVDALLADVVP